MAVQSLLVISRTVKREQKRRVGMELTLVLD